MLFGKKPVFVGLHFAKTGGTSIRAHVSRHLGKGGLFPHGPFANANSFFAGRPLLPEMTQRQKARIRFVYGHGVGTDLLHHFADRDIALFVVCRDPYRRFVSSLKHGVRTQGQFGGSVDARSVFESQPANPFSHAVIKHFGGLAPDDIADPKDRLVAILRHFRFILSTDDLTAQSESLFAALGLPPMREAKRVYREEVDLGDLSEAEIRERDDLDAFVNEAVNRFHASAATGGGSANPFGYDDAGLKRQVGALKAAAPGRETEIEAAYTDLFEFLDRNGRLEAAKTLIEAGGQTAHAVRIFDEYCRNTGRRFDEEALPSRSLCYQAEVLLRLKQPARANACARQAIEADPNNPMAFHLAGRAALAERRYAQAATDLERAVALNPMHAKSFRFLATAYRHLGRSAEAQDALKTAESI